MSPFATRLLWGVLLLLPTLVPGGGIWAEEDDPNSQTTNIDTSRWVCSLCIYPDGWFGTLDFGPGYVSDSSLKFGDYRGLEEKGLYLAVDGDAHFRDDNGRYFSLYASNLALESRRLEMRGGQQGRFEVRLAYSEVPKFRGYGTQTPFQGVGSDHLTLPADWVRSQQTGGMTALDQSLGDTPLKTLRKTLDAGLTLKFAVKWSYRVDYEHQKKNGTRPFGGGLFLRNTTHITAPVDFTTNQFDMALEYAGARSRLSFGFTGSSFDNGASAITWENPFLSGPGTESFRAGLAPDNDYYQFNVIGAFTPTPRFRLSGRAAIGRMKQNDSLLPYSINPLYSDIPLPRTTLGGKIDTGSLSLAGKLSARLARRLDLTARVKLDERNNKTAIDQWTPVLTDLAPTPQRPNRPYSFKREKYAVELRWRVRNSVRLLGGIRQEDIERTLQSVEKTRERTYWGEIMFSPWAVAQFRVKLETSDRDASPYQPLFDGGPLENPLMRKFHLADRERDRVIIDLDLSPVDRLGISLSYFSAQDEYAESIVGLRESAEQSLSLDINYAVSQSISFYGFANQDDIDSQMSSVSDDTGLPWDATTDDSITTLGIGFTAKIDEKISIGFDWVSSDAEGQVLTETGQGEGPFPILRTDLRNARAHLSYAVNARWGMKIYAENEKYDSKDWAIDDLDPDGIVSVLTMGVLSPDYSVTVLRVQASYKF